jgi:hypothetical protein
VSTKRIGIPEYDKAAPDEELFVLRAQDSFAPEVVLLWAQTAKMRGCPQQKVEDARRAAARMRAWQEINGSKLPD